MRFKKIEFAIKAFDNQKTLTLLLNCPNLKIMFSDHEKVLYINKFKIRDPQLSETVLDMKRMKNYQIFCIVDLMAI